MPATIGGVKQYLYLTMNKVVGIAAADGAAAVDASRSPRRWPPCRRRSSIGDGRVFITSGYEAGSMMIQVEKGASGFTAKKLYDLTSGAVQLRGAHAGPLQEPPVRGRAARRAGASRASASTARSVWQSPVVVGRPRRRRGRSTSAASCSPTGCSSSLDGKTGHAAPHRGQHHAVQGTGERPGPVGRRSLGPAGARRTASSSPRHEPDGLPAGRPARRGK